MSTVTDLESYQQFAEQQQAQNNAWSAEQAQKQMEFQERMSSTAHQREVADLKAAGLNPILSVNSGASVPNGASGETDTSTAGNVGAILQQVLSAQSAREVAGMYNAATIAAATIAANASMYGSDMSYANTHDHPNSIEAVVARTLVEAGLNGGQAGSGGNGDSLFNAIFGSSNGSNQSNSGKYTNPIQNALYEAGQKYSVNNSKVDPNINIWKQQVLPILKKKGFNTGNRYLMNLWFNIWKSNPTAFSKMIMNYKKNGSGSADRKGHL